MSARYSATRTALRTGAIMVVFTLVFTALMAATHRVTQPAIEASAQDAQRRLIDEVLPPGSYDNDLLADVVHFGPAPQIGMDEGGRVWRARKGGEPVALIAEGAATDGYSGRIALLVAVNTNGLLSGVRVTQHKETPGLGDYVEVKKDKNKARPWITQFTGLSLAQVSDREWKVKKDGGRFDYYAGATVTPRAVTKAVLKAVQWADAHRERLFAEGVAQ